MSGALRIRRARAEDVETILSLMTAAATDPDREAGGTPQDYAGAFATIDADPNQLLAVAEIDGAGMVGPLQLTFVPGLARRGGWRLLIESVHVDARFRSHGHGATMMAWALAEGRRRGCVLAQLTSHKSRAEAHRFYERLGFTATHEGFKAPL